MLLLSLAKMSVRLRAVGCMDCRTKSSGFTSELCAQKLERPASCCFVHLCLRLRLRMCLLHSVLCFMWIN